MKLSGKRIVVTGGAAGIGLALTRAFVREGAKILVIGRDRAKLAAVEGSAAGISTLVADIANPSARADAIDHILQGKAGGPIDIFVNNAGTMRYFDLLQPDAMALMEAELQLDLHAPVHFSTALLAHLLARPEAAIVNVTTGLIYAPYGGTPAYCAAKNGLHGFTLALRRQTRDTKLKVLEVLPPTVSTDLTSHYDGSKIPPEKVAAAVVKALQNGQDELRVGQAKALYAMSRVAPNFLFNTLNKAIDASAPTS